MPRRSPPTPLRLHEGPLPPRGKPRHTLPSLPRPAFHGPAPSVPAAGPVPRTRMTHKELPVISIPDPAPILTAPSAVSAFSAAAAAAAAVAAPAPLPEATWSGPSSPTSAESAASVRSKRSREFVRGPWDHSGSIQVPFDVMAVLPPPMPAAVTARGGDEALSAVRKRMV